MKVAVMGYGTVGSGVVEVIEAHKKSITKHTDGEMLEVSHILDLRDFENDPHKDLFTKDFNDILNDGEVKVVAEAMGGVNPAYDFTMKLLKAGKSVVTSNKELVAQKGLELLNTAKENGVNYLFEASVGGGIPIIRPMDQCLAANNILGIAGILNGTTNFILTKMIEEDTAFDEALKIAQDKGYAEKDPTADIEGFDACRKVCILASLAFGKHVYPNQVETEGITKITLEDVSYIASAGGVIKLLGQIKYISDDEIAAFVGPAVVFHPSQLASVNGVFNAILVRGDAVGDVCFYGQGAGKSATASAVVADMVDAAKHTERRKIFGWEDGNENYVVDYKDTIKMPFYVRAKCTESKAKALFDEVKFLTRKGQPSDEIAFITDVMTENELMKKLEGIELIAKIKVTDY
ncbi:MAG: homoserine dehydrogenase [Eubacterium sp.]|nr:homoserine dehydrogenase [Eubacterium sp.]